MANRIRSRLDWPFCYSRWFGTDRTAESAVELDNPIWLSERDLGLKPLSEENHTEGWSPVQMVMLDPRWCGPTQQVELATPTEETIRAIDWHPRGKLHCWLETTV